MKKIIHIHHFILLLILSIFGLPGCIDDKTEDCDVQVRIFFDYVPATDETVHADYITIHSGILPERVTRVDLYVFDHNDLFVATHTDTSPTMSFEYYMDIPGLTPGDYRFVAWGSVNELYTLSETPVRGQTKMQDLILSLDCIENDTVRQFITPLFYAAHPDGMVEVLQTAHIQEFTLDLRQDTYTTNLVVRGAKVEHPVTVSVTDNNSNYYFDNEYAPHALFRYHPISTYVTYEDEVPIHLSSTTTLKLTDNHPCLMQISNPMTGAEIIEFDLVRVLLSVRDVGARLDFSYMHEFDIEIEFGEDGSIIIIVNGWKIVEDIIGAR